MKKPVIERELCTGAAVCVSIAPEVFRLDDENKAIIKDPEAADESTIQQAIDGCPEKAIRWEE